MSMIEKDKLRCKCGHWIENHRQEDFDYNSNCAMCDCDRFRSEE